MRWIGLCTFLLLAPVVAAETTRTDPFLKLAAAAQLQVGVTTIYDPSYVGLDFPGGDIPRHKGVCSDVIVRALRDAWDLDIQRIITRRCVPISQYTRRFGG